MKTELDTFETHLLEDLRLRVSDTLPAEINPQKPTPRYRVPAAAAAAVVAGVVGAVLLWPGGTKPTFSVGEGNAEEVIVEINRPEDAAGLERALEAYGINADITYLDNLQMCAPGRYTPVERDEFGLMAEVGSTRLKLVLPPDTVRPGETFVLFWSVVPDEDLNGFSSIFFAEVAEGPVGPCVPVAPYDPEA